MTRNSLRRKLRWIYASLALVLVAALAARAGSLLPDIADGYVGARTAKVLQGVYDFFKDMAVIIVSIAAAYLAHLLQRRSAFVESLRHEWRRIVATKSVLQAFCEQDAPTQDQYIETYRNLSETIDTMRIVYRNVGETDHLIGLYPYAPLHNMRRALEILDPRKAPTQEDRSVVKSLIYSSFGALRESFLEELDLEEPDTPLLISGGRRLKKPGNAAGARRRMAAQSRLVEALPPLREDARRLQAHLDQVREWEDGRLEGPKPDWR